MTRTTSSAKQPGNTGGTIGGVKGYDMSVIYRERIIGAKRPLRDSENKKCPKVF